MMLLSFQLVVAVFVSKDKLKLFAIRGYALFIFFFNAISNKLYKSKDLYRFSCLLIFSRILSEMLNDVFNIIIFILRIKWCETNFFCSKNCEKRNYLEELHISLKKNACSCQYSLKKWFSRKWVSYG